MNDPIPSEDETLAHIGCLLLLTQRVEHVTSRLIGVVYPKNVPSWEEIESLERKTLGSLLRTLKERVEIDQRFENLFEHFVKRRNLFVHSLIDQPWFDTQSDKGRDEVWKFLGQYQRTLEEILLVVTSAVFKHGEGSGMPETKWHEELRRTGMLQRIRAYDSRSQVAFRGKKG